MHKDKIFLHQGAVTVENYTLKKSLRNRKRTRSIRNHLSINTTIIISVLNLTIRNQIHASDVDRGITSSQIVQNWSLRKIKFTETRKILRLMHTDQPKCIRRQTTVHIKMSYRRYTYIWHVFLPMQKVLEEIMETY